MWKPASRMKMQMRTTNWFGRYNYEWNQNGFGDQVNEGQQPELFFSRQRGNKCKASQDLRNRFQSMRMDRGCLVENICFEIILAHAKGCSVVKRKLFLVFLITLATAKGAHLPMERISKERIYWCLLWPETCHNLMVGRAGWIFPGPKVRAIH